MRLLFHLSGEHPRLPRAEVEAVLEGEGIGYELVLDDKPSRLLLMEIDGEDYSFIERLALTRWVGLVVSTSNKIDMVADRVYEQIKNSRSFALRCSEKIRMELGRLLKDKGLFVDLDNPDNVIHCMKPKDTSYTCISLPLKKGFNQRAPNRRPFFHPTSIAPKTARFLVNLARVGVGDTVLDPFCGTGGLLIEAGLMGLGIKGLDVDEAMVLGCRKNLRYYGIKGDIILGDALQSEYRGVDAIVSDLPYGRSSYLTERNLDLFYRSFLDKAANQVKQKGYVVCVLPQKIEYMKEGLKLVDRFELYIHKSLTREIYVYRKNRGF